MRFIITLLMQLNTENSFLCIHNFNLLFFCLATMTAADELEDFQLSELEKKAQERRERLKNLRANRTLANDVAENGDAEGLLGFVLKIYN